MTGFTDRETAFENKFAHDEELKFKAEARRNKLVGLWAAELLGKAGVQSWVDEQQLSRWLANPQGLPQTFADGQIGLQVQGSEVGEPGLLLKSSQGLFTSVEALRRIGATSVYDPASKSVTLTWNELSQVYSPVDGVTLDGKLYLPVRTVLTALAIPFHWDGPNKALVID